MHTYGVWECIWVRREKKFAVNSHEFTWQLLFGVRRIRLFFLRIVVAFQEWRRKEICMNDFILVSSDAWNEIYVKKRRQCLIKAQLRNVGFSFLGQSDGFSPSMDLVQLRVWLEPRRCCCYHFRNRRCYQLNSTKWPLIVSVRFRSINIIYGGNTSCWVELKEEFKATARKRFFPNRSRCSYVDKMVVSQLHGLRFGPTVRKLLANVSYSSSGLPIAFTVNLIDGEWRNLIMCECAYIDVCVYLCVHVCV